MAPFRIRPFVASDTESVVALWQACGLTRPWNDPYRDIARKLEVQPELFLVAVAPTVASTIVPTLAPSVTDADSGPIRRDPGSRDRRVESGSESVTQPGTVIGSVMAGYEGHRGWVNYLAASPEHRGQGIGRALMTEVERLLLERGCPKINMQVRADNEAALGFYVALGYAPDAAVSLGKRLIPDV